VRLSSSRLVKVQPNLEPSDSTEGRKREIFSCFFFLALRTSLLRKRNALARQPLVVCASEPNPFWHTTLENAANGEKPASAASDVLEALTSRSP
jgi:hypothetical protein